MIQKTFALKGQNKSVARFCDAFFACLLALNSWRRARSDAPYLLRPKHCFVWCSAHTFSRRISLLSFDASKNWPHRRRSTFQKHFVRNLNRHGLFPDADESN
jgi:hypothetical protein